MRFENTHAHKLINELGQFFFDVLQPIVQYTVLS